MGVQSFVTAAMPRSISAASSKPVARMAITPSCAGSNSNTAAHLRGQQERETSAREPMASPVYSPWLRLPSSVFKYAITSPICAGSSLNSGGMAGDNAFRKQVGVSA